MKTSTPAAIGFASPDDGEEMARAELYGLLAQLWLGAPDAELMAQFRVAVTQAPQPGAWLEPAWHDLVAAMRATRVADAAAEYDALFTGVGKPEVLLYASYYRSGFLNDKPLAELRAELQQLGLTRHEGRYETEDHVAFLFEVMRYLIAGDDAAVCNLERQRRFFRGQLQSWVEGLCDAVLAHPRAHTWRAVAQFTRQFMQVETQGFDLLDL
jgi:TorA maturation chaperone TorD